MSFGVRVTVRVRVRIGNLIGGAAGTVDLFGRKTPVHRALYLMFLFPFVVHELK